MCFDSDSGPPIRSMSGGAIDAERIELSATDGNRLAAFRARADAPSDAGVLVLPDVRGLHRYYEELALRFAEAGIDALALDYFGRTAGAGQRADDFEFMPHVSATRYAGLTADMAAGAEHIRAEGRVRSLFTVGFCFGGRLAFLSATRPELGLAGAVGFYGPPVGPGRNDMPAPADLAAHVRCPVLGIFGGTDRAITPEAIETFDRALSEAGIEHELHTYPAAPHSFFDRKQDQFADESADAWRRVLRFFASQQAKQGLA